MPMESDMMTVDQLIEKLQGMDAGELPIKLYTYEGSGIPVYTARKNVVTDEDGEVVDAYIILNG